MGESQKVSKLLRTASLKLLSDQEIGREASVNEVLGTPLVRSHWMSIVLVWGEDVQIVLKFHFNSSCGKALASSFYQKSPESVTMNQALDYFREFGNLTAGVAKRVLSDYGVSVGISLPIVTRGFDEVFGQNLAPPGACQDSWVLSGDGFEFICSSEVVVSGGVELNGIDSGSIQENYIAGDIEFF